MDDGGRGDAGGISGLLDVLADHQEAVEYDLIRLGLRLDWLDTERLSWRDLWVIVQQSPRESALMRAMHPEAHLWGQSEQLLAGVADSLRLLVWLKTKDGQKGRNQPKPIPRPGVEAEPSFGTGPLPIDQMDAWLASRLN